MTLVQEFCSVYTILVRRLVSTSIPSRTYTYFVVKNYDARSLPCYIYILPLLSSSVSLRGLLLPFFPAPLLPYAPTLLFSYSPPPPHPRRAPCGGDTQAGTVFYMWSQAYPPIISPLLTFYHLSDLLPPSHDLLPFALDDPPSSPSAIISSCAAVTRST